ncbi:hypothetical protein [Comamonas sp. JC664]|uniref:hypothetical protein n=1 Tax=Comamonas sp. JC664 TaxID=2801917 RepID=UPI00360F17A5
MRVGLEVQLIKADPADAGAKSDGNEALRSPSRCRSMARPTRSTQGALHVAAGDPLPEAAFWHADRRGPQDPADRLASAGGHRQGHGALWHQDGPAHPHWHATIVAPMATQGGLVFIAATQDYYLRAYETGTGQEVWKARLPVGSQGTPISYQSPVTGQQFVLVSPVAHATRPTGATM